MPPRRRKVDRSQLRRQVRQHAAAERQEHRSQRDLRHEPAPPSEAPQPPRRLRRYQRNGPRPRVVSIRTDPGRNRSPKTGYERPRVDRVLVGYGRQTGRWYLWSANG